MIFLYPFPLQATGNSKLKLVVPPFFISANSGYIKIIYRAGYEVYAIFKKQSPVTSTGIVTLFLFISQE
jgi:hypothetical protein